MYNFFFMSDERTDIERKVHNKIKSRDTKFIITLLLASSPFEI